MAGFLEALMNPATQGALSLSSNLLQAGGPSPYPVSFGGALGKAFQGFQNDQRQQLGMNQQQTLIDLEKQKAALTKAQVDAAMRQQALQEWALTGKWPVQFGQPPTPEQVAPPALASAGPSIPDSAP